MMERSSNIGKRYGFLTIRLMALLVLLTAVAIFRMNYRLCMVSGGSMLPTLRNNQIVLVETKNSRAFRRGDIIVFSRHDELNMKRIVGLPGEAVEIRGGCVFINGEKIPEDYIMSGAALSIERAQLFDGHYAVAGDNRGRTSAEFVVAIVEIDDVVGRVLQRSKCFAEIKK